jgi:hypothetical protein
MATIVDATACVAAAQGTADALLPVNPYTALQFHFGMLLGVDDLETGQGYPRGKIRLHNAWLHREGVVWGFAVGLNARSELTVDPGLGLDAAGHELHLDRQACLDLGAWYGANQADPSYTFTDVAGGGKRFTVHVVARFKACLTRPVPAMLEPCAGAQTETAYSRAFETVDLLLRPGLSTPKDRGYHRLRQLFRLEPDDPALADVAARRAQIQALPAVQQPAAWLQALREFAALDTIALQPQAATANTPASIFPEDPCDLVLADVADVTVMPDGAGGWAIAAPLPAPVVTVRPSHIATATIQELLAGPLFGGTAPSATPGPQVATAALARQTITLTTTRALAASTVAPAAFSASDYSDAGGWAPIAIAAAALQGDGSVRIDLASAPAGTHLRFIARGTGATPLVAADDRSPLGAPGAGGTDDGTDFVQMFPRS